MTESSKLKAQSEGELWVHQDCLVCGPVGEPFVLRCADRKAPLWTDPVLAVNEFRAGTEKDLRENGLRLLSWVGAPEIREAA